MAMVLVVPGEETLRMCAAVLDRAEAVRKIGSVLHGAELAFRVGIVVGNMRTTVGLGDAEIGQQEGDRF